MWRNDVEAKRWEKCQQNTTSLFRLSKPYTALRQILKTAFNISRLRLFKFCCIFVFNRYSQAFITKRFINLAVLKLFLRFLYYVITMPAFQADIVASSIVQFRKFIYQTLHETKICINYMNRNTENVISCSQSPDNKTEKRPSGHQNQLPRPSSDNKIYKL